MYNTFMECSVNGKHGKFSRSPRKHGRLGRQFVICGYCGQELQATPSGVFDTNPAKHRAEPAKNKSISLRLLESDWMRWKQSDIPADEIFRAGLDAVLQLPYKS